MIVNQAPWMTALEMQLHALELTDMLVANDHSELHSGWLVDRALLRASAPFSWSSDVIDAVLEASKSIPLDTPMSKWNLAAPAAWWWFEKPLPFQTITRVCGVDAINFGWLPTTDHDLGMPCICWVKPSQEESKRLPISPSQTWEWQPHLTLSGMLDASRAHHQRLYSPGGRYAHKEVVGEEVFMHATEGLSRFVLAGLAWINQRIVRTDDGHVERHRRKAFARAAGHDRVRSVSVVQLRKLEATTQSSPGGEGQTAWSCRWIVGGHWRNQPCGPKHGDRKLTYVHPYLKGPDDKPLRVAGQKVYEVSR